MEKKLPMLMLSTSLNHCSNMDIGTSSINNTCCNINGKGVDHHLLSCSSCCVLILRTIPTPTPTPTPIPSTTVYGNTNGNGGTIITTMITANVGFFLAAISSLCCAVLCCAVLCDAMRCYAMLCCYISTHHLLYSSQQHLILLLILP